MWAMNAVKSTEAPASSPENRQCSRCPNGAEEHEDPGDGGNDRNCTGTSRKQLLSTKSNSGERG